MPFREHFDCLWCGTSHVTRTAQDLEGWASLCPTCIGRAGDNGFLRARLRTALAERSRSAGAAVEASATADPDHDGFYQRTGRFAQGTIADAAWSMELDAVTAWLDGIDLGPVIVELGAGSGWWSALLASKAELWAYDPSDASLDRSRSRLVAHGLRAHLHRRDTDAPPDRTVDAVFAAFALGSTADDRVLERRLAVIANWLTAGGMFAFVEAAPRPDGGRIDGPAGSLRPLTEASLRSRLEEHGLRLAAVAPGSRALVAGVAELVGAGAGSGRDVRTPRAVDAGLDAAVRAGGR